MVRATWFGFGFGFGFAFGVGVGVGLPFGFGFGFGLVRGATMAAVIQFFLRKWMPISPLYLPSISPVSPAPRRR